MHTTLLGLGDLSTLTLLNFTFLKCRLLIRSSRPFGTILQLALAREATLTAARAV